jgi:chloramphenicol-sensitive protein RarD
MVGLLYGLAAYGFWGVAPLFWRTLSQVGASELLAQRILWGWVCFTGWLVARGRTGEVGAILFDRAVRRRLALSAGLLAANWFVFMYAVLTERVLEASLGYFINPLVTVALGRFVLGERMRPAQAVAVLLAGIGIAIATLRAGGLPWIAVALAASFGSYGLLRKTTRVAPLPGSAFETAVLLPFALAFVVWQWGQGRGEFGHASLAVHGLLMATGLVTAIPLLAFVNAAVRVRLTTLGFLQYLAPTLQFAVATLVLGEPLHEGRLLTFVCVWVGLAVFGADAARGYASARGRRPAPGV